MLSKYDWILLDLDNTLLDFSNVSKLAFKTALATLGIEGSSNLYDIYNPINAKYWHYFEKGKINAQELQLGRFKEFFEVENIKVDPAKMGEEYLNSLVAHSKWIAGAEDFLQAIKNSHQLAIITNGLSNAQHKRLDKHDMKPMFEHVFISEEMNVSKPNSLYFEHVHDAIGKPEKSKVLVIGDNPNSDIKGGRNFGYDTCWFNYKKDKKIAVNATMKISDWRELIFIDK